jgi:putative transposase
MLKVVKVRLYPDSQQQQSLAQAFGSCRWLWNYCLNLMNLTYKETGKGLSGYEVKKIIPQLKKEHQWVNIDLFTMFAASLLKSRSGVSQFF